MRRRVSREVRDNSLRVGEVWRKEKTNAEMVVMGVAGFCVCII